MKPLAFRILNVFTVDGARLSGNPLAVFEDGQGLSDDQMLALARQFNLSETTFILPPSPAGAAANVTARVRIFTPDFEMPFAGHPTLGTAQVVRALRGCGDQLSLEMKAGIVPVRATGHAWTLRTAKPAESREHGGQQALEQMLRLPAGSIAGPPRWVDTGAEQLVIPLRTPELVAQARPEPEALRALGYSEKRGEAMAYVWSPIGEDASGELGIQARFFFLSGGSVVEDPATGSACANLGGYFLALDAPLPVRAIVHQGEAVARPSRLRLEVGEDRSIQVGGDVIELGRGTLEL